MTGLKPGREASLAMYRTMRLAEALDSRLLGGFSSGEFIGVTWPSRGQEAIAAGIGAVLRRDDRLVTTYRGLHDLVAKGVPLVEIVGEVLGYSSGACRGKGGTMHIASPEEGVMLCTGIVGAGIPVAVGLALAARHSGSDRIVGVTFGDGATNTGSFHEGMNLAATWKLPVLFICQNNGYAEMTPIAETMSISRLSDRALAYGMPGATIDGNDPDIMFAALETAAQRARGGGGPTFLDCVTFRLRGHSFGDRQHYMPPGRLDEAQRQDPIPRYRDRLISSGFGTDDYLQQIDDDARRSIEDAVTQVLQSGRPALDELERDLFATAHESARR